MTARGKHAVKAVLRKTPLRRAVVARRHADLGPADAFVASYPRSGNTWLRFVLADLVADATGFREVERIIPSLGLQDAQTPVMPGGGRWIKTHEQHRPAYGRGVYLVRDVRDVLMSWYRTERADPEDLSGVDEFIGRFARGTATPYGRWDDHVRGWMDAARRNPAIRVWSFEAMREHPSATMGEIAAHLGLQVDHVALERALERNTPDSMRDRELEAVEWLRTIGWRSVTIRDGSGGDWREVLTAAHRQQLAPMLALNDELRLCASGGSADGP